MEFRTLGRSGCIVSIDLDEDDVSRVGSIAQHIESHHSRLVATRNGVLLGRGEETLEHIRDDRDVDMDNKQAVRHEPTLSSLALRFDLDSNGSIEDPDSEHHGSTKHRAHRQRQHQSGAASHADELQGAWVPASLGGLRVRGDVGDQVVEQDPE